MIHQKEGDTDLEENHHLCSIVDFPGGGDLKLRVSHCSRGRGSGRVHPEGSGLRGSKPGSEGQAGRTEKGVTICAAGDVDL